MNEEIAKLDQELYKMKEVIGKQKMHKAALAWALRNKGCLDSVGLMESFLVALEEELTSDT